MEVNAMKLRSLVIRMILALVPILPPPALIAKPQREISPTDPLLHVAVTAEARHRTKVSAINRESVTVVQNSGG
jgi:hypothetical protein